MMLICGLLAAHYEKMSAESLITRYEDIYQDLAHVHPRFSWTQPQRWVEDEVCHSLGNLRMGCRPKDPGHQTLRCMLSVRQAYRQVFGRPSAFDSGRAQTDVQQAGSKSATSGRAHMPPIDFRQMTSADFLQEDDYSGDQNPLKMHANS